MVTQPRSSTRSRSKNGPNGNASKAVTAPQAMPSEPTAPETPPPAATELEPQPPAPEPAASTTIEAEVLPEAEAPLPAEVARALPPFGFLETVLGLLLLLTWVVGLSMGITVGTQTYIDLIRSQAILGFWEAIGCILLIVSCHTIPSMAILCCLSALLGAIGLRSKIGGSGTNDHVENLRSYYVAAAVRGFFVFVIVLSGLLIVSEQAFTSLTPERYIRLVGLSSLMSFLTGYDPMLFTRFVQRLSAWTENLSTQPDPSRSR